MCLCSGRWIPKGLVLLSARFALCKGPASFPGYSESVEELPAGFCCVKLDLLGRAVCERDPAMAEWGTLTTVMVRQLPIKYTQGDLFSDSAAMYRLFSLS